MVAVQIFNDKAVAVRIDAQAMSFQDFVQALPVSGMVKRSSKYVPVALGI